MGVTEGLQVRDEIGITVLCSMAEFGYKRMITLDFNQLKTFISIMLIADSHLWAPKC